MKRITVLIADDHKLFRDTLTIIINAETGFEVVASCGDSVGAIEAADAEKPDIILMDINMTPFSWIEATDSSFLEALEGLALIYRIPSRSILLETSGMDETIISSGIKETLYRIVQEQLNNINKYASAKSVLIRAATHHGAVIIQVTDNGVGFNTIKKKTGVGLVNIRNRSESYNGTADIISSPGNGCSLTITIPLQHELPAISSGSLPILPLHPADSIVVNQSV